MIEGEHDPQIPPSEEAPEGGWISKRVVITEMPSKDVLEDFLMGLGMGPTGVCFNRETGKFTRIGTRREFWEERMKVNAQGEAYARQNEPLWKQGYFED